MWQSSEIQFFGATTLHTKMLKHWHEVPKENRDELRQKLFASIILYANGQKIVLNRLCIAVFILSNWNFACDKNGWIEWLNFTVISAKRIHRSYDIGASDCDWRYCENISEWTYAKCTSWNTVMDFNGNFTSNTRRGTVQSNLQFYRILLNVFFCKCFYLVWIEIMFISIADKFDIHFGAANSHTTWNLQANTVCIKYRTNIHFRRITAKRASKNITCNTTSSG